MCQMILLYQKNTELAGYYEGAFETFVDQKIVDHPEHWQAYYSSTK